MAMEPYPPPQISFDHAAALTLGANLIGVAIGYLIGRRLACLSAPTSISTAVAMTVARAAVVIRCDQALVSALPVTLADRVPLVLALELVSVVVITSLLFVPANRVPGISSEAECNCARCRGTQV